MDISSASSVGALSGQSVGQSVENSALKKSLDIEAQNTATLINSIASPEKVSSVNLPEHLGQNVNTKA